MKWYGLDFNLITNINNLNFLLVLFSKLTWKKKPDRKREKIIFIKFRDKIVVWSLSYFLIKWHNFVTFSPQWPRFETKPWIIN